MPRKPDTPCSRCGKLLYGGTSSLPPGKRMCQPCRRARGAEQSQEPWCPTPRICVGCGTGYMPRHVTQTRCRKACGRLRQGRSVGRAARLCEVCGAQYRPTHRNQRTCGRVCGERLRREVTFTMRTTWPSSSVHIKDCPVCERVFVARPSHRKYCSGACAYDVVRSRAHIARADLLGVGDASVTLKYLIKRDRGRCGLCGKRVIVGKRGPRMPSIDHIVPLSRGGRHELANVWLACYRCNLSKNNRGGGEQLMLVG